MRDSPVRDDERDEGRRTMTSPRKTSPGSTHVARTSRAGRKQADATTSVSSDMLFVQAAGVAPQNVLIVTRDQNGTLRMWCNGPDPFDGLAMAEYARSRLQVAALRHEDPI